MVKTYLRYEQKASFGVICSPHSNVVVDWSGNLAVCGALEKVLVWNIKQGVVVHSLHTEKENELVTRLCLSPDKKHLAVGYDNGHIKVWRLYDAVCVLTLHGHRSGVTALAYNHDGSLLASGSRDTDIVVWDPLAECGLFRLKGHKSEITDVKILRLSNHIISSSKDTFIKVWDLDTQHCIHTLVDHNHEVWSFDLNQNETRMVTGSLDNQIRVFHVNLSSSSSSSSTSASSSGAANSRSSNAMVVEHGSDDTKDALATDNSSLIQFFGSLNRQSRQRVVSVRFNSPSTMLAVQNADKTIEFFSVRDEETTKKKMKRRVKRQKEKQATQSFAAVELNESKVVVTDEFGAVAPLRCAKKITSFVFVPNASSVLEVAGTSSPVYQDKIVVVQNNNIVSSYDLRLCEKVVDEFPYIQACSVELPGHRSGVRCIALSDDDSLLLSCSLEQLKVWNIHTRNCIRSLDCANGVCAVFVPGSRYVVVGTKLGTIELWDIHAASLVTCIQAHTGAIWTMDLRHDEKGVTTGGADKEIKFWDFEIVSATTSNQRNAPAGPKQLALVHARTLRVNDEVLCVKHSPDGKYVAASLLDTTIKVFFFDSLKFFLPLYGHKLPVLSIDISSDSTLLVSGSADKNVKLWGLDFGDCHKSMFAHQDHVMKVQFVPKTHYFFSVGKDRALNYWDGDKFEQILNCVGHHSEAWTMTVSKDGDFVVTASEDRSMRIWKRTDDIVFLDEEREKKLQDAYDKGATVEQKQVGFMLGSGVGENVSTAVHSLRDVVDPSAVKSGELLMEALDVAVHEEKRMLEFKQSLTNGPNNRAAKLPANPFLRGASVDKYVLNTITSVTRAQLEESLVVLPFEYCVRLLGFLERLIDQGLEIELCTRTMLFVVALHQSQIIATPSLLQTLKRLRASSRAHLTRLKDEIGFNVAGLSFVKRQIQASHNAYFFGEASKPAASSSSSSFFASSSSSSSSGFGTGRPRKKTKVV